MTNIENQNSLSLPADGGLRSKKIWLYIKTFLISIVVIIKKKENFLKVGNDMMETQLIQTKLEELSEELKKQVFDYIDFLITKQYKGRKKEKLKFDWEGGLSELKEKYTSVELQHKAMEWR